LALPAGFEFCPADWAFALPGTSACGDSLVLFGEPAITAGRNISETTGGTARDSLAGGIEPGFGLAVRPFKMITAVTAHTKAAAKPAITSFFIAVSFQLAFTTPCVDIHPRHHDTKA
jgi:hypothetical protein